MATPALLSPQEFAGKIRAKYPGAYDHLSDDDLTQRVVSKYPQYGGSVQLATSGPARPNVQMENYGPTGKLPGVSEGAGLREALGGWAGETGSDIGGGTADIAQGNIARGGHRLLSAMQSATLPAAPFVAAAAPAATMRALAAGSAGSYGAGKLAELVGADPDQAALAGDVGGLAGGYVGAEAPNLTRGLGPKVGAVGRLAAKDALSHVPVAGRLVRRPSLMDYMEAAKTQAPPPPIPPELSTPARTLPGQIGPESIRPPAAPIPPRSGLLLQGEVGQPPQSSLLDQMSAQPERRVSQQPYTGPNRRIAPEERGFMTAPPLDPERIGVDYRPAEDLGVKVRQETEAAKGPIKRGGAKALKQAEALGQPATSNKLIQKMGGQPVETVTGEREPYVPIGFREGPPKGTVVPQTSEEMQGALEQSLRRVTPSLKDAIGESQAAKEPWQMTRQEFGVPDEPKDVQVNKLPRLQKLAREGKTLTDADKSALAQIKQQTAARTKYLRDHKAYIAKSNEHFNAVKQAVAEGKPVPAEVLNDYPYLSKD